MQASLFLGCTVPVRNLNYEVSARKVAIALGITFIDNPNYGCCGYPLRVIDQDIALTIAARILAQANQTGLSLVSLCSACASTLMKAAYTLEHDSQRLDQVQKRLSPLNLEYQPGIKVYHFAHFLLENIGVEGIRKKIVRPLTGFTFAPHYGCHFLKPKYLFKNFDNSENPQSLSWLIDITGANSLNYQLIKDCCGGEVLSTNEELAGRLASGKLLELTQKNITALVVSCPFCNVMFEGQQKVITKLLGTTIKVPIVYLSQILGLALGLAPRELAFEFNRIKPKEFLEAFK